MATQPQWIPAKERRASSQSMIGRSKWWVRKNQMARMRNARSAAIQSQGFFVCFQIWREIRVSPLRDQVFWRREQVPAPLLG